MLLMAEKEQNLDLAHEALNYYDELHTDCMADDVKKYRQDLKKWKQQA